MDGWMDGWMDWMDWMDGHMVLGLSTYVAFKRAMSESERERRRDKEERDQKRKKRVYLCRKGSTEQSRAEEESHSHACVQKTQVHTYIHTGQGTTRYLLRIGLSTRESGGWRTRKMEKTTGKRMRKKSSKLLFTHFFAHFFFVFIFI
ncbi:uncharacterized protein K452DRAFT_168434 [Aplosporella prunicola CBS 121167]|uniref:Uncharacterized protein n=1 Tax=Aplosporella prunicola CBS 121167 TaxID=1176127 RepID=A0A6A6BK98_9PEZI|nr:uncharacterized protein K452DRAFT_168434 [Aplosporella prunicola CBS 121167]KAF2143267.1 hypothetical protein K452DRAFT_168434 [Aplosporella prunicola CBS 121167]